MRGSKSLASRFSLGLGLIIAGLGAAFALAFQWHLRQQLESELRDKAFLALASAEAVQSYVRKILRPALWDALPGDRFIIEAMSSSFVTRAVMEDLGESRDLLSYRRVAAGARNPDFEATPFERSVMADMTGAGTERQSAFVTVNGEQRYLVARLVRLEAGCMRCHGEPAEAPAELIERYGPVRGFHRKVGEVIGADIVTMPAGFSLAQIKGATIGFALMIASGMVALFATTQLFFRRLVVANLRHVTDIMRERFPEESSRTSLPRDSSPSARDSRPGSPEEIETLISSVEVVAEELFQARAGLAEHAATLERKVAQRTGELALLADSRQLDVELFLVLSRLIVSASTRRELLSEALPRIADRFAASRVAYSCVMRQDGYFAWPDSAGQLILPESRHRVVATGQALFEPGLAVIPIGAAEQSRGALCLWWDDERPLSEAAVQVLSATGRQLAVAMDQLDALDGLLRQHKALSLIFEGITDPLLLIDGAGQVVLANTWAKELALSLTPAHTAPPPEHIRLSRLVSQAAGLVPALTHGFRDLTESLGADIELGQARFFTLRLYPLPGYGQASPQAVVSLREITAEKRMAEHMRASDKLAAVGRLSAGLAHEIRNPLGVITCYAELLKNAAQDPQLRDDAEIILKHAQNAKKTLDDLLTFARPKAEGEGPLAVGPVVAAVVQVFSVKAKADHCRLELAVEDDVPPVGASAAAMEAMVTNLVLNALDAVDREHGEVRVRVAAQHGASGPEAVVEVLDNGPGVPEKDHGRIFDPFFTTKAPGVGTGLGLAVVASLARDLGGRVELENRPGALFRIVLPGCPPQARPKDRDPTAQAAPSAQGDAA